MAHVDIARTREAAKALRGQSTTIRSARTDAKVCLLYTSPSPRD